MPNALLNTSVKNMKDAFTFNVLTAHALTLAAVPLMLEHSGGGNIINITSTMGKLAAVASPPTAPPRQRWPTTPGSPRWTCPRRSG